ncbi:hypothetical protein KI387_026989, partial [Taxus chinensis]
RKKQKVIDEVNSEETKYLDAYIGDKYDDDEPEGGKDHLVYEIHDYEEDRGEYNKGDEEKEDEEEAKTQGKG